MNKLMDWRRKHRMSRRELAEQLGVTVETVRRWEAGLRVPRPATMARIRAVTGGRVGPGDFYEPKK